MIYFFDQSQMESSDNFFLTISVIHIYTQLFLSDFDIICEMNNKGSSCGLLLDLSLIIWLSQQIKRKVKLSIWSFWKQTPLTTSFQPFLSSVTLTQVFLFDSGIISELIDKSSCWFVSWFFFSLIWFSQQIKRKVNLSMIK